MHFFVRSLVAPRVLGGEPTMATSAAEPISIAKIRKWLTKRGYRLSFGKRRNDVCFARKVVSVQARLGLESKTATLLHECGHILVHLCRRKSKDTRVAGASWKEWRRLSGSRSKHAALLALQEEMVAWDRGYSLASRLKIRLSTAQKRNSRTKSLMTYVRHSAK
jgi:hypothetical protein